MFLCYEPLYIPRVSCINHCVYDKNAEFIDETGEEFIFYFVMKGLATIYEDEAEFSFDAGLLYVAFPQHTCKIRVEQRCELFRIHIPMCYFHSFDCSSFNEIVSMICENRKLNYLSDSFGEELYNRSKMFLPKNIHVKNASVLLEIIKPLNLAIAESNNKRDNFKLKISYYFLEFMIKLSDYFYERTIENYSQNTNHIIISEQICKYIYENYMLHLTGKDFSKAFSRNFDYMNRVFKKEIGITIFGYLNKYRVEKVKEYLQSSQDKLAVIAKETGFSDPYYLSRVFKKETGVSPLSWKRGE